MGEQQAMRAFPSHVFFWTGLETHFAAGDILTRSLPTRSSPTPLTPRQPSLPEPQLFHSLSDSSGEETGI